MGDGAGAQCAEKKIVETIRERMGVKIRGGGRLRRGSQGPGCYAAAQEAKEGGKRAERKKREERGELQLLVATHTYIFTRMWGCAPCSSRCSS
jgi:hypothetical protein